MTEPAQPELMRAAALALALMNAARVRSWADLVGLQDRDRAAFDVVLGEFILSEEDVAVIGRHEQVIGLLRAGSSGQARLLLCPACQRWALVASKPPKCQLTEGCLGVPMISAPANKTEPPR